MSFTALLVDDEPLAREGLHMLLGRDPDVSVIREARNGREAVESIRAFQPDIVFLDVQMPLSTWLVAPTSTSARAASFRPEVEIDGRVTRVLAEQAAAIDPGRLGNSVGYLSFEDMRRVDAALRIVLDL